MGDIVILHGIGNDSSYNWFPWLKNTLEHRGYSVFLPDLPNGDNPHLDEVFNLISRKVKISNETILVGHSSGATLALGILQKLPKAVRIAKTFLVAGFIDEKLTPLLFQYIDPKQYAHLFPAKWDWKKIKSASREFIIFHSLSDPFVQLRHARTVRRNVNGTLYLIDGAKHFSVSTAGEKYRQFPELLDKIVE